MSTIKNIGDWNKSIIIDPEKPRKLYRKPYLVPLGDLRSLNFGVICLWLYGF